MACCTAYTNKYIKIHSCIRGFAVSGNHPAQRGMLEFVAIVIEQAPY